MTETTESGERQERREPGRQKRDNIVSGGLDADRFRAFEDWRVSRDLSTSAAVRRLIGTGLDYHAGRLSPPDGDDTDDDTDRLRDRLTSALALLLITGYPTWAAANGRLNLAAGYIAFLILAAIFQPQLEHIWSRFTNLLP